MKTKFDLTQFEDKALSMNNTVSVFTFDALFDVLRPPQGVCEAHLHQAYKPSVIGAILSQTYGSA